jgi:K+ transporter
MSVREAPKSPLAILSVAALGVVFGDIGTSPLYTFKTVLDLTGAILMPAISTSSEAPGVT